MGCDRCAYFSAFPLGGEGGRTRLLMPPFFVSFFFVRAPGCSCCACGGCCSRARRCVWRASTISLSCCLNHRLSSPPLRLRRPRLLPPRTNTLTPTLLIPRSCSCPASS